MSNATSNLSLLYTDENDESCVRPESTLPEIDECKLIIIRMIEQAIRDYLNFAQSSVCSERGHYETACQFLFDEKYTVDWGDEEKTTREMMDCVGLNLDWIRERSVRMKDARIRCNGRISRRMLNKILEENTGES